MRLNDALPADINILAARGVPHRFHARHDARARRYSLSDRQTPHGVCEGVCVVGERCHWMWTACGEPRRLRRDARFQGVCGTRRSGFEAMKNAAVKNAAVKNAAAKSADDRDPESTQEPSTKVLVDRLDIVEDGDLILVGIEGSHFLWKMVRRVVGVLVEIGRGAADARSASAAAGLRAATSRRTCRRPGSRRLRRDSSNACTTKATRGTPTTAPVTPKALGARLHAAQKGSAARTHETYLNTSVAGVHPGSKREPRIRRTISS